MKLIVNEITTSISQVLKPNGNKKIGAVRPHLYIRNRPSGTIKVQIASEDGTLISESDPLTISNITESNEYHGYVRFYVQAHVKKNVNFKVIVVCSGYVFDENAFVGVCTDFDLRKYQPSYEVSHPRLAPMDLEVWTYSEK